MQRGGACWHCAARREITERSEEAPGAKAAQPSWTDGKRKALRGRPVGVGMDDKLSGVVRGECRGGLGGAAAPNRPPSAARRAGGPNNIKRKTSVPAGHRSLLSKDKPCFTFFKSARRAYPKHFPRRRRPKQHKEKKPPCPQGTEASFQRTNPDLISSEHPHVTSRAYPKHPAPAQAATQKFKSISALERINLEKA